MLGSVSPKVSIPKAPPQPPQQKVGGSVASPEQAPSTKPSVALEQSVNKGSSLEVQLRAKLAERTQRQKSGTPTNAVGEPRISSSNSSDAPPPYQLRAAKDEPPSEVKDKTSTSTDDKKSRWSMPSGEALAAISGATAAAGGVATTAVGIVAEGQKNAMNIIESQNAVNHMRNKMGATQIARAAENINQMATIK